MLYVCYQLVVQQSLLLCAIFTYTCNLFSFVQHQSVASNEPHDPAWSRWNSWSKWLLVTLFVFAFVDYLWLFVVVNEPTCHSEVYLHLCVVDISIWTACDAYCELSMMDVMFIWMWYIAMTKTNKLIICGSFAKCYTWQKPYLLSAMKIHSAKLPHITSLFGSVTTTYHIQINITSITYSSQ